MQPSDEALVNACRRGETAAWEALIERYQRLVYSIARRAGLGADLASEVFQHVFTSLLEHLDRIEQPSRVGAWLATTARRESRRLRQLAVPQTLADAGDDEDIPDTALLPEDMLLQLEEQHRIRVAVAALDDRCRRLLTLLFYCAEPPPYAEVARALGTPEGSIGPTRARCLQKLRRSLESTGFW